MIPKIIPTLIPGFVTQVPAFVFLEATLLYSVLAICAAYVGKLLNDAQTNGHYSTVIYWVLEPSPAHFSWTWICHAGLRPRPYL